MLFSLDRKNFLMQEFNLDSVLPLPFDRVDKLQVIGPCYSVGQCFEVARFFRNKYPTISVIKFCCTHLIYFKVTEEYLTITRASFDNIPLYLPTLKTLKLEHNYPTKNDEHGNITIYLSSSKVNRLELDVRRCINQKYTDQHIVFKIEQENVFQYFEWKRAKEVKYDYQFKFNPTNDTFNDHRFFLPSFVVITIKCSEIKEIYVYAYTGSDIPANDTIYISTK